MANVKKKIDFCKHLTQKVAKKTRDEPTLRSENRVSLLTLPSRKEEKTAKRD